MRSCYTATQLETATEQDGVQYAASHRRWYSPDGHEGNATPQTVYNAYWLPPLYPYKWTVWRDHTTGDVCIALLPPRKTNDAEEWVSVATGKFSDMWDLFLKYVALVWEPY